MTPSQSSSQSSSQSLSQSSIATPGPAPLIAPTPPPGVTYCRNRTDDPTAPWYDPSRPTQEFKVAANAPGMDLSTPGAMYAYKTFGLDANGNPALVPAPPILCTRAAVENVPGLPTVEPYAQWLATRLPWAAVAIGPNGGPLTLASGFYLSEVAALIQSLQTCPGVTSCTYVLLKGPVGNTALSYSYPANDSRAVYQIVINGEPFNMGDGDGDTASDGLWQSWMSGGMLPGGGMWPGTWTPGVNGAPPVYRPESFSDYGTTSADQMTPMPVADLLSGQVVSRDMFGNFVIENTAAMPAQSSGGAADLTPVMALLNRLVSGMNALLAFFRLPVV